MARGTGECVKNKEDKWKRREEERRKVLQECNIRKIFLADQGSLEPIESNCLYWDWGEQ